MLNVCYMYALDDILDCNDASSIATPDCMYGPQHTWLTSKRRAHLNPSGSTSFSINGPELHLSPGTTRL